MAQSGRMASATHDSHAFYTEALRQHSHQPYRLYPVVARYSMMMEKTSSIGAIHPCAGHGELTSLLTISIRKCACGGMPVGDHAHASRALPVSQRFSIVMLLSAASIRFKETRIYYFYDPRL